MIGSKFTANRWEDVLSDTVMPNSVGLTGSCTAGSSSTVSYVLTDDMFFRGLDFVVDAPSFGDTITMEIIDTNGITGVPPGTVLATPISNWNISPAQKFLSYEGVVPKKGLATFTINVIYTSAASIGTVNFGINFILLKLLQ